LISAGEVVVLEHALLSSFAAREHLQCLSAGFVTVEQRDARWLELWRPPAKYAT
jgi:hypothetical protein